MYSITLINFLVETQEETYMTRIQHLTSQLNDLKSEHYQLVYKNKEQSEKLTRELENSIKTHYLKNVMLSFLTTNDVSVHQNLIKVIIQAMHFTEEEASKIL